MSVSTFVLLALASQIASGDRYGNPSSSSAPAVSPPPATSSPARSSAVSPPPPAFTSAVEDEDTSPIRGGTPDFGAAIQQQSPVTAPPAAAPRARIAPPATNPSRSDVKPSVLMASMLTAPAGSRLMGRPVKLADIVRGASSREAQSQRINAYWDLCSSVADYYLGVREQDELQRLKASVGNDGAAWQQAAAELGVRLGTSQRAAVASQYRLSSLMGSADPASLPLPADLPHCGDYYARFEQVFAGRATPEAQQLSELLPMRYTELCDSATAITRAEELLQGVSAQRGSDGTGALRALEFLALRRRAFVQIARDYNRRIERYSELASPGAIDSDRLIGMLIMRSDAANTATRPTTSTPPYNRQSQVEFEEDAQTFAEGWESIRSASAEAPLDAGTGNDENVRPATVEAEKRSEPRREHSLLVPSG